MTSRAQLKHLLTFRDYFQTESTDPIDFSSRYPPNLLHDLLYLSSYIHDAKFLITQVQLRDKKLYIPMERERWELYDLLGDIHPISSLLTIEPVEAIRWKLRDDVTAGKFLVSHIFFGESFWTNFGGQGKIEMVISGPRGSKLRIEGDANDMNLGFRLVDLVDPEKARHVV